MHNRGQHANNDLKSITLKAINNSKRWLTIIAKVSQFDNLMFTGVLASLTFPIFPIKYTTPKRSFLQRSWYYLLKQVCFVIFEHNARKG